MSKRCFDRIKEEIICEIFQTLKKARLLTDNLSFPPINDRMCEGARTVYSWTLGYLNERAQNPSNAKLYLDSIGQNSSNIASKFRGALLGLALGDALGTTLQFSERDKKPPVTSLIGGGPFKLKPGQWTDDTSMALCLAHSLIRREAFIYDDQLDLYFLWWKTGIFSVNRNCFDIGNTVVQALQKYVQTGESLCGSKSPETAGNGSLMRLAPVALFHYSNPMDCIEWCGESSKTTHGALEAVDACRYLGALIHGAIKSENKLQLCTQLYEPVSGYWKGREVCESILNVANNAYKKSRDEIKSTGYVVDTLEAALWAFANSNTFEEGVILAANLAGDSDTVAAVYGQIAGAYYGEDLINPEWIRDLAHFHVFYYYADRLLRFGVCDLSVK